MKLTNKIAFSAESFKAQQSGMKSSVVNAEPTLTANSTAGKFTISAPVSKALGIPVGGFIGFLNDSEHVEGLIQERTSEILAVANELGVDIDTPAGHKAVVDAATTWAIYKGVAKVDRVGNPIMVSERYTKEDKLKFIEEHKAEIIEANRDELVSRVGNENASDAELAEAITVDDIPSPQTQDYTGSRCATTSNATGVGVALNFTDTAIWNQLKYDLDEKTKVNRIFDVDLATPITTHVNNGKEEVQVLAFPLVEREDKEPIIRGAKGEE